MRVSVCVGLGLLICGVVPAQRTEQFSLTQRLDHPKLGFAVRYPATWSASQDASMMLIVAVPPERLTAAAVPLTVPRIYVSTEPRRDHDDAIRRLRQIASEYPGPVTYSVIGGWPALQRRVIVAKEQAGAEENSREAEKLLKIDTAIAAGSLLIRADGRLEPNAGPAAEAQVRAIEAAILPRSQGTTGETTRDLRFLRSSPKVPPSKAPASHVKPAAARPDLRLSRGRLSFAPPATPSTAAGVATPGLQPGAAQIVINGGYASEPEIAVSTNGQNIVIAQQSTYSSSNDGGQTFPNSGSITTAGVANGGDSSVAYGLSGNFYEGTINIGTASTSLYVSTDKGKTFTFSTNAFTCPAAGTTQACGFNSPSPPPPPTIPDQEHIAADRFNGAPGGDQVYFAWRNGFGNWGIACSTNSGQAFGAAQLFAGDFPRITVGQDGFVYVVFVNGGNINLHKFSSCQNGLTAQAAPFPSLVASAIAVTCPVPGLDRCNSGNQLHSPTVAVDDANANHVFVGYAQSTSTTNENVVIQDSTDGGATWPAARTATVSSGIVARRFMPWVCSVGGAAHATWYDRRAATAANNDLTDYYASSAFVNAGGTLVPGTEVQINAPGSSDGQCNAGKVTGSTNSWPQSVRATNDATTCSVKPQVAGRCSGTNTPCNLLGPNTCTAPATCQNVPTGGQPKYGDYNGNACAAGRLYTIWASATPAPGKPATGNVDLYFASSILCCAPQIQVPGPVVFGDTCVGSASQQSMNVCNNGKGDLSVDAITSSDASEFFITAPSSGYPLTLAPGACFPFQANFRPNGPGNKTATFTVPSNDPVTPSAKVQASGKAGQPTAATAIASGGDFGTVCPGSFKDLDITVQNSGTCPLIVTGVNSSSGDFKTASVLSFPITIAPGASTEIPIRFEPTSAGAKAGTISIFSNDPSKPAASVAVKGLGGQPVIATIIADTGDFGTLCRGLFRDLPLTVSNSGTCPLRVTSIASSSPEFETASVLSFPLVIAPGSSLAVPIRFRPTSSGKKAATITIGSDDPTTPSKTVNVKAFTPPEYICHPPTFAVVGINAGPAFGDSRSGDFSFGGFGKFLAPFGVRKNYGVQAQGEYMYEERRKEGQFDGGLLSRFGHVQAGAFGSFKSVQLGTLSNNGLGQAAFTVDFLFLHRARFGFFGSKSFRDSRLRVVDQFGGSAQVGLPHRNFIEGNLEWLHRHDSPLDDKAGATIRFVHQWRQIGFTAELDLNETYVGIHNTGRLMFGIQLGHWPRPSDLQDRRNPLGTYVPQVHYELNP